ncbi:MAG: glycosyltransferase family 39 protein [Pseudanabaenaceae cyanobacterium bins.68]|nr:glycosyltransferase family 39 protein [Pseudanabaenaceae cyanobacterium bins.68]
MRTSQHKWLAGILAWGLAFRLIVATYLPPGYDEAYYYLYTLHPALSYFDHPPLVGWVTGFGIWLSSGLVNGFTLRLGTVLLYTGSLYFFYRTSGQLFGQGTALLSLAIASTIPFFQIGFGVLTLPDSPLMFFWTAALWLGAVEFFPQAQTYQPSWRLTLLGLLVGGACLGKYHGVLLGLGILLFALLSRKHRRIFASPWLYGGMLMALVAIAPVLIWNFHHDWVSIRFQSGRAIPQGGYRLGDLLLVFLVGVGYLFPTFGFPLWCYSFRQIWHLAQVKLSKGDLDLEQQKFLWILCISVPIFLGFTLMGGYRQILPSWHMPGFWGATLLLGHQIAIAQRRHPLMIRNWLLGSGLVIFTLLSVALLHITQGIFQKDGNQAILGGFWPVAQDASTELVDLPQLRQAFTTAPSLSNALNQADFVFSNNFFLAGQVAVALANAKPITTLDTDLRGFAFWSRPQTWLGKNALYITSKQFEFTNRQNLEQLATLGAPDLLANLEPQLNQDQIPALAVYRLLFDQVELIAEVPIQRGGATTQVFLIYRATNLQRPYPRPYGIRDKSQAGASPESLPNP